MKRYLLLCLIAISPSFSKAQKTHSICGEYTYHAPSNISKDEAVRIAIDRARLTALADEFGTLINQNNMTLLKNEGGKSTTDFKSISESEVKGEWIEDTKEPETQVSYEQGMLVVRAKVCGKAREIVRAAASFSAKLLRNGTEDKHESNSFKDKDDLYLSFQSPINGYLAVYLADEDRNVFCLLPYAKEDDGQVEIKHGLGYLFFDARSASEEKKAVVDELTITCSKDIENNQIYIIFSPSRFVKANDKQKDNNLPRELPFVDFQRWLTRNRNIDKDMQVEVKNIQITK